VNSSYTYCINSSTWKFYLNFTITTYPYEITIYVFSKVFIP